ncbi:hypothetical protein A3H83_01670 [Candidatus Roizmanbacteria bacterium RIFCSPLOWO2_02_FULL_39_8]|uniref:Uncharacterized protein n=1 Tax=Candidatus Roizmanbacteria bacterium RIFCSPHIGHO2_01_FULL_39_24 TaxID=1802032 RepID=A0A1F7GEC4_9BACT|nr:MAG: hypothetical protein A2799_03340 [Candidatus Roizmanbacteria bacterium RIFCSPHIGHO2_01_FULL_39_24]OGK50363.1 MAG: hypothetical protein A3A56_00275 [Candidatus Roizmanbacteria bacterium RIFCSPLOWO2_01_FULL_40_32]OGK56207.1 MAG: hypothetical protein A3H83_01670 [Candidatus Roizmanbacteria bacterium RIFCSPLOWO2_02_FULL_39_8]
MSKTIVTHMSPDFDAITSVWLVHRFMKRFEDASVAFVPAGNTLDNEEVDSNPDIIHVDTGMGKFDHHQTSEETCASRLILDELIKSYVTNKEVKEALFRMVAITLDDDHFRDIYRDQPDADIYDFLPSSIIDGAHSIFKDDSQIVYFIEQLLDCVFKSFIYKIRAEKELLKGYEFQTVWGRTIAIESDNRETSVLAQKRGVSMVISKSSNGQVRVKTRPDVKQDLKPMYEKVLEQDPNATWFYHVSGHMLLNGSSKNPDMIPSKLTIKQLIVLAKDIS